VEYLLQKFYSAVKKLSTLPIAQNTTILKKKFVWFVVKVFIPIFYKSQNSPDQSKQK